jgi:hypothetical protein
MSHAVLSLERKLDDGLRELGCSPAQFVKLVRSLNEVQISVGGLSETLSGRGRSNVGQHKLHRLLNLVSELNRVRSELSPTPGGLLPLNWSDADGLKVLIFGLRVRDMVAAEESEVAGSSE